MSERIPAPNIAPTEAPPTAGAPRLGGLPGVHRDQAGAPQVLETERYDTDDRRLAAAGIALAVRRGDPSAPAQWQLDLPDGDRRERLRVSIPPDDVGASTLPVRAATS